MNADSIKAIDLLLCRQITSPSMASPGKTTPASKARPPGSAAGRGQLLRHSSFYPGVIPVDQEKNHSLLLRGNQMKTGGAIGNKPKNKKSKNGNTSEFGNFPKPAAKAKRKVPPDVKERQARFDAMIEGNLTNLPPLPKSAVRIFLSSTFSDMRAERNTLAREVYPILKEYCASLDLDFQVVDMRWGITEDSQNDHSVEDLCLREITNCQNLSLGPNFVCILGDRYGFQLIPSKVCVEEFELLLSEAADTDQEGSVLLRKWYLKDENAVPNVYVLQPIRIHFPHYGLHNPGEEEASAKDSAEWYSTVKRLRRVLRDAAVILHKKGHLSDQHLQQYFWSVTECEINTGVLQTKNPGNHALFFHRELIGLADDEAGIYIDISEGDSVDTEARNGLKTLSTKTIPKKLGEDRRFHFSLPWRSGGVDPSKCHEHAVYISEFCKKFILNITQLIEDAHEKRQSFIKQSEYYSEPDEIIHHLQFCVEKCKTFCGRKETLCSIRTYVLDQSARKPLVIHAESGAGKTSLMAYVMHSLPKWIDQPYIGVIRFLGTSPGTVDLYDVLFSLCGQLADATDLIMEPIGYQNFTSLVQYMPRFLRRAASAAKVPIVILLDSVDQLSPANQAYCMKWLPLSLPPNVKLVLSTLSKENDILVSAKNHLTDQKCYIEVPILPKETVQEILIKYLSSNNRTLTADQSFLVTSKFFQDPCPLYLKLLLDKAMTWHSFTQLPDMVLGENSQKAIHLLFERLEIKYGNILIHAALGYLTVSLNGITQIELEDVLSCDNDVLDDVYRFHDPPVEGIVRIPQVLWARIYNDLKQYLVERLSQGKTTMFWYHRQFIEVAKERYLTGNNAQRFHKKMLEIYLEETGVQRDIHLSKRQKTIKQADRQVTHQPMVIKNKRKMECITHHLLNAKSEVSMDTAKQMVYCNYDFLTTKVSAFSVKHVVSEMDRFLIERPDKEIKAIRDFMQSSFADLRYPMQLAVHLLAGVPNPGGCIHLEKLLKEAKSRVTNHPKPLLVPEGPCFAPREQSDEALHNCLVGCKDILCSTENMICTEEEGLEGESVLAVLDANSGEHRVFEQLRLKQYITKPLMVERDVFLANETALVACNMDNGDIAEEAVLYKLSPDENVVRCLVSEKDKLLGVFGSSGELQVWDVVTRTKTANIHLSDWTDITFIGYSNNGGKLLVCGEKGTSGVLLEVAPGDTENETIIDIPYAIRSGSLCILKDVPFVIGCSDPYRNLSDIYIVGQRPFKLLQTIKFEQRILCLEMIKTTIGPLSCVISDHGSVYLYDLLNGQLTAKYELDDGVPNCVLPTPALVRGVECILTGRSSGTIAFHSLEDTTQVAQIKAFESPVKGVRLLGSKLVAYAENTQLKVWDFVSLLEGDGILCANTDDPNRSLYDETVTTNIELSLCSRFIYTVTTTQLICVWEVESGNLKASYSCGLQPTEMYVARGEMELLVLLDKTSGTVRILSGRSGEEVLSKIPNNVLSVTLTKDKSKLYLITDMDGRLKLFEYELLRCRLSRSFSLQKGLGFTSVAGVLSQTERYMVLKVECTAEDKKAIESQWKKGGFVPQPHPYRFSAIDLTHTSGALLHCYRQLSKIPALGSAIIAYTGNTMIFCVRRCVCFWDIPTGRCDQMITKSGRHGMFYNPSWLGGGDSDATAFVRHIVQSDDKNFVIMGSDDGYAATYKADTGAPVKMKAPLTKHIAPVCYLAVSGDSRWMFSVCRKHYLKMWDLNTAEELFSLRLDGKIRAVRVSPDSRHLALLTGSVITRVMLFRIMPGKQEPKKSSRPEIE